MHERLDKYLTDNRLYNLEGPSGVRNFERIVRDIGNYRSLQEFLEDNPGALNKMMEFVSEWMPRNADWQQNLVDLTGEDEEDDEEDE